MNIETTNGNVQIDVWGCFVNYFLDEATYDLTVVRATIAEKIEAGASYGEVSFRNNDYVWEISY